MSTLKQGIDISKWQGAPDWDKLAAAHKAGRLDFVILRAGYGANTIDPAFAANYAAASARGIPLGAYWYAYWQQATPAQEAAAELIAQGAKKNEVKRAAIAVKAWISQLTQEEE